MRFIFSLLLAFTISQYAVTAKNIKKESTPAKNTISDLVLIYDGGLHRQAWTADRLKPYVYRQNSGETEWLFDGFLFLEIFDNVKNIEYYPGYHKNAAAKTDWQFLLDTYFDHTKSLGALENILDELAQKGDKPVRKRKVVISIPTPIKGFTGWGSLNGKALDFNKTEDQIAAEKWFVNEVLQRWKSKKYKHIELTGFYWVDEDCNNYEEAIRLTKQYVCSKRKNLYWIPYWNAAGGERWKELGFDFAWEQPNYFFTETIPYSRLNEACAFGKKYGLGMEMEFDERITQPAFRARFDDYVKAFTENKVWETSPVAYYEGGGAWGQMAQSTDPEVKRLYYTLSDIIIKRQKKADQSPKHELLPAQ